MPLAGQQIPTERIHNRQRITPAPVARPELTLVIDRPHHIRPERRDPKRRRGRPPASVRRTEPDASVLHQDTSHRADARPLVRRPQPRLMLLHIREQLFGAPPRMLLPTRKHGPHDVPPSRRRRRLRPPRALQQPGGAFAFVHVHQLVPGLAANPELLAQLRHRKQIRLVLRNESNSFIHRTRHPPRHRKDTPNASSLIDDVLPMS